MRKALSCMLVLLAATLASSGAPPDRLPNLVAPAEARGLMMVGGGVPVVAAACADSSCAGFLVCQNFETSTATNDVTLDNSETWAIDAGTPITNSTTTPLRGTKSLALAAGDIIYKDLGGDKSELYFFFRFRTATAAWPDNKEIFKFWNSSFETVFSLRVLDNEKLYLVSGNIGEFSTTVLAADTVYYIWGRFKNGTGTAVGQLYISETPTKPAAEINVTTGTQTGTARYLWIGSSALGLSWICDQVLVKATDIGDVCE